MRTDRTRRKQYSKKALIAFGLSFGLVFSQVFAINIYRKQTAIKVDAADYSGVSGGFTRAADGTVSASFQVTNNGLDMKGWLLCLFESKPSIDSSNKLTNSNDAHPYSYSACKHYFFASNTSQTGSITVSWSGTSGDQKDNWTSSTSTGASGKTLKDYINNGTNWHLIIGPRHYNTSWGDSGIGAGSNGYWENCDYYVGALNEVFPSEDKDMTVSVQSYNGTYTGTNRSITVNVSQPSSGYTIKYRTASSGSYNLITNPTYKDVGNYTVYFQVTASGYKAYSGSGTVKISKANPTYTAPKGKIGLKYTSENQNLIEAGSTNGGTLLYSLDGSSYSTAIPQKKLVGTYTVYYKIEGNNNYNGVSAKSLSVSIYPNDKTALEASISQANEYVSSISTSYPEIASVFNTAIEVATEVYEDDNKTVFEIAEARSQLINSYDSAHAQIADILIDKIGEVRYTDSCLEDIINAENAYQSLTDEQKALISDYNDLVAARNLYNRLNSISETIGAIGEVTYDEECLDRIMTAKAAFEGLSKEEQALVPTLYNELKFAEDIYNVLKLISELGEVEYSSEYQSALEEARNAYDALDSNEQGFISNYQELLDKERTYENVDNFVNLVSNISEDLEYVGTHNPEIDKAREAYNSLSPSEKLLVPEPSYNALTTAEEEYKELKVEHERKEIEDREAGVAIAIEGGSGIPDTISIDVNSSSNNNQNVKDNIDYQTIESMIVEEEAISSICEIKFYQEVEGQTVEVSLSDIEEGLTVVIKLDVPTDVDDSNFKIVLLDEDNNLIEVGYDYDPDTRVATIYTDKVGTFAIITPSSEPTVAKEGIDWAIILALGSVIAIGGVGYLSIKNKKNKED